MEQIEKGSRVRLENGERGTVISVSTTNSDTYPYVYEVMSDTGVLHITNNVKALKGRSLAKVIAITHNL